MHFYELTEEYNNLRALLNSDELFDEEQTKSKFAEITGQLSEKAENMGKLVLEFEANSKIIKEEVDRLSKRAKTMENKADWIKEYIKGEMQLAGIEKIQGQLLNVTLRKNSPSCKVVDDKLVPPEFIRIIPEQREVNKSEIVKHFKETGEVTPGTEIITDRKSITIK